jgi:hypothetical protein
VAAKGSGGRRPGPAGRLAGFLLVPEDRPVASGAARLADAVIAAVATMAAVAAVLLSARGSVGPVVAFVEPGLRVQRFTPQPARPVTLGILLGTILTTLPLAFRRIYPP